MIASMEEVINELPGWCTAEKAGIIYDLVKHSNSQLTVELGVFGGRSFIPMAMAHQDKGSGKIIGIDSWKVETSLYGTNDPANNEWWASIDLKAIYKEVAGTILRYGLTRFADLMKSSTQEAAEKFADSSIDIIHQDSAHNVETITEELALWIPKLKAGGYWIADDTHWKEAKDGYKKLPDYNLELVEDHTTWQIWRKK